VVKELQRHDIEVSLFVDPVPEQIEAAREVGADKIEIHTGQYANARTERERHELLNVVHSAAKMAREYGLGVNAGHGLNYLNIIPFRQITEVEEVSIGHAIISRAVFVGLDSAVREMLALVR
jgi:pyridoxine 5-phosphate synthase